MLSLARGLDAGGVRGHRDRRGQSLLAGLCRTGYPILQGFLRKAGLSILLFRPRPGRWVYEAGEGRSLRRSGHQVLKCWKARSSTRRVPSRSPHRTRTPQTRGPSTGLSRHAAATAGRRIVIGRAVLNGAPRSWAAKGDQNVKGTPDRSCSGMAAGAPGTGCSLRRPGGRDDGSGRRPPALVERHGSEKGHRRVCPKSHRGRLAGFRADGRGGSPCSTTTARSGAKGPWLFRRPLRSIASRRSRLSTRSGRRRNPSPRSSRATSRRPSRAVSRPSFRS